MPTNLTSLRAALRLELGSQVDDEGMDELLKAGVALYNAEAPRVFSLSGTALDRDATELEKRALVLFAVMVWLNGEIHKATLNTISVSNVAGRTDLTNVEWALNKRRTELRDLHLKPVMDRIISAGVMAEVHVEELGATKDVVPRW